MRNIFNSKKAPKPVGQYPHARKVGNTLYLSGVGPRERDKKKIPGVTLDEDGNILTYNIETQCKSVFQNVKLILEASGSSWDQLIDVTVFLTNMKADFKIYNKIYAEYFADNQPCRTTVEISSLPTPIAIELKCIATIDSKNEKAIEEKKKPSESSTETNPIKEANPKEPDEQTRSW